MQTTKIITHSGKLELNGITIPCYVLKDGTRVLSSRKIQEVLKMVDETENTHARAGSRLDRYLTQKAFKQFIFREKEVDHFSPILCSIGKQKIHGYEASILVEICDGILEARKHTKLSNRQTIIADQCEILIRSFAKIGLIALIDEATGYQHQRESFELQKILNAYISDEIVKWQLTFTDEFYKQVYRLWNIDTKTIGRPSFIGNITIKYIYDMLPEGVVDKIKEHNSKSPKGYWKYKWHQSLSPEIGREHLKKQIAEVTTLMSISDTRSQFEDLFLQKYFNLRQEKIVFL